MFAFITTAARYVADRAMAAYNAVIEFFFGKKEEAPATEEPVDLKWENEEAPSAPKDPEVEAAIKAQREELETAFLSAMKGKDFAPALASSVAPSRVLTAEEVAAVKDVISRIEEIGDTMQILSAVELVIGEENMESNVYGVCAQQQVRGDYK